MSDKRRLDGVSVLFVDDNLDSRLIMTAFLEHHGARITAVASGPEALTTLERTRPDVIVSDISMPGMTGIAFLELVRKMDGARIPAIAYTAFPNLRNAAHAAGFDSYFVKPLDPVGLVDEIARLAERGRATSHEA